MPWKKIVIEDSAAKLGSVTMPYTGALKIRNSGNTADITAVAVDPLDHVSLYGGKLQLDAAGSTWLQGPLSIGSNPATAGDGPVLLPNNQFIVWRNAANTANILGITVNASNKIQFGTGFDLGNQSIGGVYSISQYDAANWMLNNNGAIHTKMGVSTTQTITPNAWNTITHNLGVNSWIIYAVNGDYSTNAFRIEGVQFTNTNSFRFYASGGSAATGRINYLILV